MDHLEASSSTHLAPLHATFLHGELGFPHSMVTSGYQTFGDSSSKMIALRNSEANTLLTTAYEV